MSYIDNRAAAGGGAGTVTNTGGSLTNNAVVLGAGGNDTKVSTGVTTNGVAELDLGVAGTSGVLGLLGTTSGTATLTAPAVAGTRTNAVTSTNNLATPGIQFVNPQAAPAATNGIFNTTSNNQGLYAGATGLVFFWNDKVTQSTTVPFHMIGGNLLTVASNFTTAANTSLQTITGLVFNHVSSNALTWNFHAVLAYSQATANAAVSFGIQAATNAPTNIFATATQQITVGPPATYVSGVLATLTTTTATAIVSGTPGAIATNYTVTMDGTLQLAASANAINFMVSTATSGDAVTVLQGSYVSVF
jgi:hypothetical protein